jgi:hypothetical protein
VIDSIARTDTILNVTVADIPRPTRSKKEIQMDTAQMEHEKPDHPFDVVVIHTSEKRISVKPDELVGALKLEALDRFKIPVDRASQYVLASAPGNPQAILDDTKTVTQVGLHKDSRVYLEKPHTDA